MTYFPSASHAFKSRYYVEHTGWDADFKVDYDGNRNPINLKRVREAAAWLRKREYRVTRVEVSRTSKGFHARIWVDRDGTPVPPWTVLRVQGLLGDDPVRQRFNERRVRRRENAWNVLWNEKWRNAKLIYREKLDRKLTQQFKRIFTS